MTDDDIRRARELIPLLISYQEGTTNRAADTISALLDERETFYLDYRTKCDEQTKALRAENTTIRTLMDCYNLGGWTDSLRLMEERDALALDAAYWKEEARRYRENADFWRSKFEIAAMNGVAVRDYEYIADREQSAPARREDMQSFAEYLRQHPDEARDFFKSAGVDEIVKAERGAK